MPAKRGTAKATKGYPYPEHEKMRMVQAECNAIGGFLEWLGNQEYIISKYDKYDRPMPLHKHINEWLEMYFDIDGDVLEQEKRAMLKSLQDVP